MQNRKPCVFQLEMCIPYECMLHFVRRSRSEGKNTLHRIACVNHLSVLRAFDTANKRVYIKFAREPIRSSHAGFSPFVCTAVPSGFRLGYRLQHCTPDNVTRKIKHNQAEKTLFGLRCACVCLK
jgi:hypothetical protein